MKAYQNNRHSRKSNLRESGNQTHGDDNVQVVFKHLRNRPDAASRVHVVVDLHHRAMVLHVVAAHDVDQLGLIGKMFTV